MSRAPYTFVVLRYRHDPVAGELMNVGVVMHAPRNGFLGASFRKGHGRLSQAFPDLNGVALRRDLANIERAFTKLSKREGGDLLFERFDAATMAARLLGKDDSAFVWSEMGSGVTEDPEATLNQLFERFVTRYDERMIDRRSDAEIWKPFRDRLAERRIEDIFQRKVIRSPLDEVVFEHAWKNGAWHCFQPLSFDLAGAVGIQDKAARWAGHMYGLQGAENFRAYFIVGAPSDPELRSAYDRALAFICEAPTHPKIVREEDLETFVDELASQVLGHRDE